jgi:hypothetical protein
MSFEQELNEVICHGIFPAFACEEEERIRIFSAVQVQF